MSCILNTVAGTIDSCVSISVITLSPIAFGLAYAINNNCNLTKKIVNCNVDSVTINIKFVCCL